MLFRSAMDPASSEIYKRNYNVFRESLVAKISEWGNKLSPLKGRELIGYHNEWVYLMNFAGLEMKHFLEPKPGVPPSPKQVEFLVNYMKANQIGAIVQASYFPTEAGQEISKRTGAKLVLLSQNVGEVPEASDYLSMLDHNIIKIIEAHQRD